MALPRGQTGGGRRTAHVERLFDRYGNTGQRPDWRTRCDPFINCRGLGAGGFEQGDNHGVQAAVHRFQPPQERIRYLARR